MAMTRWSFLFALLIHTFFSASIVAMSCSGRLANQRVLITGAGRGIARRAGRRCTTPPTPRCGSTLRPRSLAFKASIAAALRRHVWPLLEQGVIRPVIYREMAADQAAAAHALMESSTHVGKIVLRWR